jgi:hypothetical protein
MQHFVAGKKIHWGGGGGAVPTEFNDVSDQGFDAPTGTVHTVYPLAHYEKKKWSSASILSLAM